MSAARHRGKRHHTVTLVFVRNEGLRGLTDVAVVEVQTDKPQSREQALAALEAACTDWVAETEEGRAAWAQSCEDFNVGDLTGHHESLLGFLARHGIRSIQIKDAIHTASYDRVLVDCTVIASCR